MEIDRNRVAANVKARNAADAVSQLAIEEAGRHTGEAAVEFWKRVVDCALVALPPEHHPARIVERGPLAAMTHDEATAFEAELVPFGRWANRTVSEVPLDYLDWLDSQPDFRRQLNRYLRCPRVQREERELNQEDVG